MNMGEFELAPESAPGSDDAVRFELAPHELPASEGVSAIVREALVPLIVWSDVPVRLLKPRRLGRMEAFLLEAGVALGRFELAELEDATSVPANVIATSAGKLLRQGTFVEIAPGVYEVDGERSRLILDARHVEEEHHARIDLAYFPRQDEVIADEALTGRLLQIVKKLRAPRQAPFLAHIDRGESVRDFIAKRVAEGRMLGSPYTILDVDEWPKHPSWPKLSPCYYARGHVRGAGAAVTAEVSLWGHERRKSRTREYHSADVRLDGSVGLIHEWLALSSRFSTAFRGGVEGLPPFSPAYGVPLGSCQWRVGIYHTDAAALATDHWLTETLPISICSPTAKVDVRLLLDPADEGAAELFALDAVAQRVEARRRPHADAEFSEHLRGARERYPSATLRGLSRARVEERLWSLKRFMAVYAQRVQEDFAYD